MKERERVDQVIDGFTVTCKCGSTNVEMEESAGYSDMSGSWVSVDFVCADCGRRSELFEA